jgi:hypothetical protein
MKRDSILGSRFAARLLWGTALAVALARSMPAEAQAGSGCEADGFRVVTQRWDAVLNRGWEFRQHCAHPDWPTHSFAIGATGPLATGRPIITAPATVAIALPLLVHAGDQVRLWQRDAMVRIEMTGVAEQSARQGEPVVVRITRQTEDAGLIVERIPGTVRGAGDVEMER